MEEKKEKEEKEEKHYIKEKLVANLSYTPDVLYRYQSIKNSDIVIDGNLSNNEYSNQSVKQYMDFIFILRNRYFEIENNEILKYWFSGYVGILNITINNGTNNTLILFDNNLNILLNEVDKDQDRFSHAFRNLNDNYNYSNNTDIIEDEYEEENYTSSFIKIDFYENGEIKNIFLPNSLFHAFPHHLKRENVEKSLERLIIFPTIILVDF